MEKILINTVPEKKNDLTPLELQFTFYPKKNIVELNLYYDWNFVVITLSQKNREDLIAAMQQYIQDYQAKKLLKEKSGVKAYFGSAFAPILWGMATPVYNAKPELRFEYRYITDQRPYFMINSSVYPPQDSYGMEIRDSGASSPSLRLAFTPIQCKQIIDMLNQDALVKIVSDLDATQSQFDIPEHADSSEPNAMF